MANDTLDWIDFNCVGYVELSQLRIHPLIKKLMCNGIVQGLWNDSISEELNFASMTLNPIPVLRRPKCRSICAYDVVGRVDLFEALVIQSSVGKQPSKVKVIVHEKLEDEVLLNASARELIGLNRGPLENAIMAAFLKEVEEKKKANGQRPLFIIYGCDHGIDQIAKVAGYNKKSLRRYLNNRDIDPEIARYLGKNLDLPFPSDDSD